jgi:hypothetical protein
VRKVSSKTLPVVDIAAGWGFVSIIRRRKLPRSRDHHVGVDHAPQHDRLLLLRAGRVRAGALNTAGDQ